MPKHIPPLDDERKALVEENINHAYWLAEQWIKKQKVIDADELKSMALFGLTKAAATFDKTKNIQFNTYARCVIENEFKNELKKSNKYAVGVYDSTLESISLREAKETDITTDKAVDLQLALKKLPDEYRDILLEFYDEGYKQNEIAEKHNMSQASVSLIIKKSKEIIASYISS